MRTGGHVDGEKLPEVGARVVLGEHGLDGVLEGEVEGLGGEVAQHVGQVAAPEGQEALAARHTHKAVDDACTGRKHISTYCQNRRLGRRSLHQRNA